MLNMTVFLMAVVGELPPTDKTSIISMSPLTPSVIKFWHQCYSQFSEKVPTTTYTPALANLIGGGLLGKCRDL